MTTVEPEKRKQKRSPQPIGHYEAVNPERRKKHYIMNMLGITGKRFRALQKIARRSDDPAAQKMLGCIK
jgi:hypothetical protein